MSRKLAILAYHKIGAASAAGSETWYYVPTETFQTHLKQLRDGGWNVIDVRTFLATIDSSQELPDRSVMITFDDGYCSVLREAAPLLARMGLPAVMFVPTQFVGSASTFDENSPEPVEPICSWKELRELEEARISVQSHAVSHRTFSDLSPDQIDREVRESKDTLQQELSKSVQLFSYPYNDAGRDREFTEAALRRSDYKAAFHFTGGVVQWPVENFLHLTRIPVWPNTDVSNAL